MAGAGRDVLYGGQGGDWLFGGSDGDELHGDRGNDTLSGDRGADTLTGGDGADRFLITAQGGSDLITDFDGRHGDRIQIEAGVNYAIHGNGQGDALIIFGSTVITVAGVNPSQLDNWIVG
jgi:Ca2+-binding RTX toxin-like protein